MVRNYKRKKEKAYTRDMLLEAVKLVKQKKLNSYAAAERFNIPRSTIISHVYATRGQKQINPGKDTVFSRSFEQEISSYLKIMEKNGFALTTKEVKALVSEYVKRNGLITPFKEDIPGDEWLRGFRKRNGLSIKKPQSVEMARKRACNPYTVYEYFDLLEDVLNDLHLTVKPERIYNLDETSFCNDPSKTRVIGEKGVRCTRTTSSPGRDNTTVLLATNAVGDKVPPLIIFQGKHLWNEWCYKDQTVKTAYTVSQKGWMETSIFEKYFKSVFLPAIGNDRPVLVIYDGHSTHVDLNVIKLAQSENITILKLPPHSSDTLQPLDCSGMKPMKDRWDEALVKWQRLHIGAKLPKMEFSRILTEIWANLNPVILQNGFKKTGIYPFNRHAISKNIFDPLALAQWEKKQALKHAENNEVKYANLIFRPDVENNVETYHETKYDCTHQVVENQVYVTVPTLLSLTLQIFNKSEVSLEDIGSDGNCTEVKVTEHKEELVIEGNPTKVDVVGSKIEQEINERTMGITEKNEGINTIVRKKEKLDRRVYKKQEPGYFSTAQKQDSFEQVLRVTSDDNTKRNTSSKIRILQNILIAPATPCNKENFEVKKEIEKLKTYEKKQQQFVFGNNNESPKIDLNQNLQHSQKADTYNRNNLEKAETQNIINVSFQTLLLEKIARNDPPKTKKRRVTKGAEILTYKEVIEKMERDQEEKKRETEMKKNRRNVKKENLGKKGEVVDRGEQESKKGEKIEKHVGPKRKIVKKNMKKNNIAKKKKIRYETDSDTSGSYQSDMSSESEDAETFYRRLLEDNSINDSINIEEDLSNLTKEIDKTSKKETKKTKGNLSVEPCLEKRKKISNKTESLIKKENLCIIYNKLEDVPSTSKDEFVFMPKEGDFILGKFCSALGKKTYKYVCLIEEISENKAVVKGMKSYKQKNTFKFIKNDVSIIDFTDIIKMLPQPDCVGELHMFSENIDVIEK